jgi:hypothetical protein
VKEWIIYSPWPNKEEHYYFTEEREGKKKCDRLKPRKLNGLFGTKESLRKPSNSHKNI